MGNNLITKAELKELIKREKIKPDQIFSKEQILADSQVKDWIELEEYRAENRALNEQMEKEIAEDTKKSGKENPLIPDDDEKPDKDDDNDLIPD